MINKLEELFKDNEDIEVIKVRWGRVAICRFLSGVEIYRSLLNEKLELKLFKEKVLELLDQMDEKKDHKYQQYVWFLDSKELKKLMKGE